MDLTKRQQEIFDFIRKYSAKYGYPPTVRDIGRAVGLASSSTVHQHLANLERKTNPADGRSLLVGLTTQGLARLRAAQITHHETVRELMLDHLGGEGQEQMSRLWEQAMPGAVSSDVWPLQEARPGRT